MGEKGMSDATLALIGALAGGSVLKIVESWLNRSKDTNDQASDYRDELRKDIECLRIELTKTRAEVEQYREKYYQVQEQLSIALIKLAEELRDDTTPPTA
jgi:hypothetical protein